VSGMRVGVLLRAPCKTQVNHQTQRSIANDLGQPATRTDQQASHYDLNRCSQAASGHFKHSKWSQTSDKLFTVLWCCFAVLWCKRFFSAWKSWGGHTKIL